MASTNTISPAEAAARTAVALLLANWISDHGYTLEDVDGLGQYGREAIVRLSRVDGYVKATDGRKLDADYVPSDATWAAAMTVLREHEAKPDPFAGFPRPAP